MYVCIQGPTSTFWNKNASNENSGTLENARETLTPSLLRNTLRTVSRVKLTSCVVQKLHYLWTANLAELQTK